jgi:adenylosuccinate lyase
MIERYSRPQMRKCWNDEQRYQSWLDVELAVVDYYHAFGLINEKEWEKIHHDAAFDIKRIVELEALTRHDVVAFTRAVSETLGDESRWIHYGMTSTDVVDTANALVFKKVDAILKQDILDLMATLKKMAVQYRHTTCIGRTHGVHADITCFGLKFALWYDELNRQFKRFDDACADVETGKISGAVGTFANTSPDLQDYVCKKLNIRSANISTQTLQRDRHAHYLGIIALIGSTLEKIGVELRHLQRTEVREVEEGFAHGQKGSSAMPHKRNPISSENIAGCARVLRGYMLSAYENIPLWHERDISHSSAERIILPDSTLLLDYMLNRMNQILTNLTVFEDRMLENIDATHGVVFAQRVMTLLIEKKGFTRETAYDLIQPIAMDAWTNRSDFRALLNSDDSLKNVLSPADLDEAFSLTYHLRYVDAILLRVGINI